MKLNQILLFAGAWAASEDDERFKNPIKKIEKLQSWGEGCIAALDPPPKRKVDSKFRRVHEITARYLKKFSPELLENESPKELDRGIDTSNPCTCLRKTAEVYLKFYPKVFPEKRKNYREHVRKLANKMLKRLSASNQCPENLLE